MIPADSSIDDEPPLFPVSFYGKKIAKIRTRQHHAHPQTIGVIHLLENLKDHRWDPKITGSGHCTDKVIGCRALGEVTSLRVLGRTATKMTNRTRLRRNKGCLVARRLWV
jgi:hypothetical protein